MAVRPNHLRVEASSHCQLRCPSCPTTTGDIHPAIGSGFLKADDFRRLLESAPWLKSVELSNYGEIFLNPELSRILEIASARGVAITALNGVNLNSARDDNLEAIVKFKASALSCSIDGASPEIYRLYRRRGNFDRVIKNIKKINEYKVKYDSALPLLTWQFVVFEHNQHEIEQARTLAQGLGMRFVAKLSWDEGGPEPAADLTRELFGVSSRTEYAAREGRDYMQPICRQLWNSPQINWDGKVLGCCRNFWGDFGGNAFTQGVSASVNSPGMIHARRMLRGRADPREGIPCTSCEVYLTMCRTGKMLGFRDVGMAGLRQWLRRLVDPARRGLGRGGIRPPKAAA